MNRIFVQLSRYHYQRTKLTYCSRGYVVSRKTPITQIPIPTPTQTSANTSTALTVEVVQEIAKVVHPTLINSIVTNYIQQQKEATLDIIEQKKKATVEGEIEVAKFHYSIWGTGIGICVALIYGSIFLGWMREWKRERDRYTSYQEEKLEREKKEANALMIVNENRKKRNLDRLPELPLRSSEYYK